VLAATVPVATDVALTVPVETVDVMYSELDDPPKVGLTTTNATAPTPTRISAIAANLIFIHASRVSPSPLCPWRSRGHHHRPNSLGASVHAGSLLRQSFRIDYDTELAPRLVPTRLGANLDDRSSSGLADVGARSIDRRSADLSAASGGLDNHLLHPEA
jgi:hypothetical protein